MKLLNLLILLAFLASLSSLIGNWHLAQRLKTERTSREQAESRLVQLGERNTVLETQGREVEQYQKEMDRLREQIKDLVNQKNLVKKELDGAYAQVADLGKRAKNLEVEKGDLATQLNVDQVTEQAIVREAARLPTSPPMVVPIPATRETPTSEKAVKTKPEKRGPEEPQAPAAAQAPTDRRPTQVLSINREFKFVVVNLGLRGGTKVGQVLLVERGGKVIGRVQVEKLYESFSACTIIEEDQAAPIQEGDLVRLA